MAPFFSRFGQRRRVSDDSDEAGARKDAEQRDEDLRKTPPPADDSTKTSAKEAETGQEDSATWRWVKAVWRGLWSSEDESSIEDAVVKRVGDANKTLSRSEAARRDDDIAPESVQNTMEAETSAATKKASLAARGAAKAKSAKTVGKSDRSTAAQKAGATTARGRAAPLRRARPATPSVSRKPALLSHTVEAEDVLIHAAERPARGLRASSSRAILLIHGAGVDHRDWTFSFVERLDPTWRVLAFDRPGFGRSTRSPGVASALPSHQARVLRKAAAALGVEEAIVVGHSWGGAVAMAWGLDAPQQTLGVASLAGAVAPWSLNTAIENGRRMQMAALTAMGEGGLRAAALDALQASFSPAAMPKGYAEHLDTALATPTAATMADVSTINGALALMSPNYPTLDRPVELVYGEADIILDPVEQGERAAALLPNAQLSVIRRAGHMVHHTHAKQCSAAISRLISPRRRTQTRRKGTANPA